MASVQLRAGRLQYRVMREAVNRLNGLALDDVSVDGVRMPFLHGGTGPALLLLHGFGDSKETWFLLLRLLSAHFSLLIPDLPGYGDADPVPSERATIAAQAAHVRAFLDALGRQRVHLCGNSMGGGIGVRIAAEYPERLASLTLLGPMGPIRERSEAQVRWEDFGDNPLFPTNLLEYDAMLRAVMERQPPLNRTLKTFLAERHRLMRGDLERYFDALVAASSHGDIPQDLSVINTPTLILHGERDRIVHPSTSLAYGELIPHARVLVLPEIGHAPQIEAPRLVARALVEHIRGAEGQRWTPPAP